MRRKARTPFLKAQQLTLVVAATLLNNLASVAKADVAEVNGVPEALIAYIDPGEDKERLVELLMLMARRDDFNGDGLDIEDIELREKRTDAEGRTSDITEVLINDLNGDLTVTSEEAFESGKIEEAVMHEDLKSGVILGHYLNLLAYDQNRDYSVSLEEVATYVSERTYGRTAWDPLESTCRHASLSIL